MTATVRFDKWENTASTKSVTMDQIAGGSGLVPVVPSSVVVASGTATTSVGGLVTFSGASSVSLNNVFSSGYKNYRVMINHTGSANPTVPAFRFRASGADNTSAVYNYAGVSTRTNAALGNWTGNSATYLDLGRSNSGASTTVFEIYAPQESVWTEFLFNSALVDNAGLLTANCSGVFAGTNQFDGLTFYASGGGTVSGTIQVYGFR